MTPTQNDVAAMLMALTQGIASWFAVVPDVKHVQNETSDNTMFTKNFRRTELTAGGITLGIGALGSLFMKSIYPFLAAVLIVALLAVVYEWSFRSIPPTVEEGNPA